MMKFVTVKGSITLCPVPLPLLAFVTVMPVVFAPTADPVCGVELKRDIQVRLDDFIMAQIIAKFSDEDVEKFETLLNEKKTQAEVQQFAHDHISNFTAFLTDVLIDFQSIYLDRSQTSS